jgi:hypothetical protein
MYGIRMHPIPVIGNGVLALVLLASQASHEALTLHVARYPETGILEPGRREVHVGDNVLAYRACFDARASNKKLGTQQ